MKTIDYNALAVAVQVSRAGGFTAAARSLATSKQWVSRRVAEAERALGVPLFERTTRSLKLTQAGARVLAETSSALTAIAEALHDAEAGQREPVGRLRVTAPLLFGRQFLMPIVAEYLEQHPGVQVELLLTDRHANLVEEDIDVAVRAGKSPDSGLLSRRLGVAPVPLVASPALLARLGVPRTIRGLASLPAVLSRPDEQWALDGVRVKPRPALVVAHLEAQLDAALLGLGVAALLAFLVRAAVAQRQLTLLLSGRPVRTGLVQVLTPHRRAMPLKVRRFIDLLVRRSPDLSAA
ncbi:MAG: LysR family transcriptional regulator [Myxococcaceae bacterium]|nr:LysR family transcriptional regulator [Myxococcaceae bacterium]